MKALKNILILFLMVVSSTAIQGQVEVIEVWPGDANNDGTVNFRDFLTVGRYWDYEGYAREDFDFDIEDLDFDTLFIDDDTILVEDYADFEEIWEDIDTFYIDEEDDTIFVGGFEEYEIPEDWFIEEDEFLDSINTEGIVFEEDEDYFWYGEYGLLWDDETDEGENLAFADGDGDGVIGYGDFWPIYVHYEFEEFRNRSTNAGGVPVTAVYSTDTLIPGEQITIELKVGDDNTDVSDLYGAAMSFELNTAFLNMEESFISQGDGILADNSFPFSIVDAETGRADFAITNLGGTGETGTGTIAIISTVIEDDIMGEIDKTDLFNLDLKNTYLVSKNGEEIPSTAVDAGINTKGPNATTSVNDLKVNDRPTMVTYPNPATDELNIILDKSRVISFQIVSVIGNVIYQTNVTDMSSYKIDVSDYPQGMYYMVGQTDNGRYSKSFVVD